MSILEMSFYGGVMILAVVVLRALTVHRLPKRTFVVLWLLTLTRLLLPFTIPSPASVYTLAGEHNHVLPIQIPTLRPAVTAPTFGQGTLPVTGNGALPAVTAPAGQITPVTIPAGTAPAPAPTPMVPVWTLVWLGGLAVCALFFLFVYMKNKREFRMSLPVENDFLMAWLEGHPLGRRVRVRQFDRITAPLTYGLVRPVILLPADTDWDNGEELSYVLEHEFIHIKRWDSLTKLLLAAAVCVHWFNPLVWIMFFLANRDLELSCDEGVLRRFGTGRRGDYARTLIGMEETRGGLTPIYNHFSKSAIEERVVAIMKTKKLSLAAVIAAVVLVAAVAVMFVTSPREEQAVDTTPTPSEQVSATPDPIESVPAVVNTEDPGKLVAVQPMLFQLAGEYHFLSGAGGWETVLYLNNMDTSNNELYFSGRYHDSEMGERDPELYPNGTVYRCSFTGSLTIPQQVDEYTYSMRLNRLDYDTPGLEFYGGRLRPEGWQFSIDPSKNGQGAETNLPSIEQYLPSNSWGKWDSQTRYVTSTPHGLDKAEEILIYLPGTPVSRLPEEALNWLTSAPSFGEPEQRPETLPFTVLYNVKEGNAFFRGNTPDEGGVFEALAGSYHFLSGAGGWQTFLNVNADGSFHGQYHDSEMGEYDPIKYPKGTVYLCNFDGAFERLERVDQYTYTMRLGRLDYVPAGRELVVGEDGSINEEAYQGFTQGEMAIVAVNENDDWWLINMRGTEYAYTQGTDSTCLYTEGKLHSIMMLDTGTRYITSTPYGLDEAEEILIYLPGTPVSSLPEEALSWLTSAPGFGDPENRPGTLPFTVLYNVKEQEAFFQGSLTEGGETLVPLENAVDGLELSWCQEGESLFLNDGAVEIELRSGDYYVYRRGYVTDVLQNPMMLQDGVPHLPISFCSQYLSEGGDLCHAVQYFFKDEIRDALGDPTASASQRVLAAVSLPRSMGIETVNLDPNKIFEERELDDYPEALAAELTGMGVPNAHKRTYSEYRVLTEARTVARAGLANEFLEDLPREDPDDWTVGEYYAWQQSELLESRLADLTEEERKFVEEKDIQPEDLPVIQREFYFDFLSHTDEELKTVIEAYYQFALAKVMGE